MIFESFFPWTSFADFVYFLLTVLFPAAFLFQIISTFPTAKVEAPVDRMLTNVSKPNLMHRSDGTHCMYMYISGMFCLCACVRACVCVCVFVCVCGPCNLQIYAISKLQTSFETGIQFRKL